MNLPLCFHEKHSFSVFIDSLNQHLITGRFKVSDEDSFSTYPFNGLVYQLTNQIYNFTFSIIWDHINVPSYTIFSGILQLNNINNQNILDLKWLLIKGDEADSLPGSVRLLENEVIVQLHSKHPPFPHAKLHSTFD